MASCTLKIIRAASHIKKWSRGREQKRKKPKQDTNRTIVALSGPIWSHFGQDELYHIHDPHIRTSLLDLVQRSCGLPKLSRRKPQFQRPQCRSQYRIRGCRTPINTGRLHPNAQSADQLAVDRFQFQLLQVGHPRQKL